ncbi:MAG: B12-binding domain-containing radical SAM protein [Candidatus Krumholzibacteria bacterium]|nr:B12-binding domain-containing radical SAM protein [Candidatus Krumholzibacteria bacterium]
MRVVLADPPKIRDQAKYSSVITYPNIGILSLAAYLRAHLPEVEVIYLEVESLEDHLERVRKLRPDVYGISFATYMKRVSYMTLEKVREKLGGGTVLIAGGAHPTVAAEEVFENSPADVCFIGEGEESLRAWIASLLDGGDGRSVDGIAYRGDGGKVVRTAPRRFLDTADIPVPAWDMIDFERYGGVFISKGSPSTCILFSRGCPFDCTFCSNPVWRSSRPWLRTRSPEQICEEIKYLYGRGIRELYIRADEFNSRLDWTLEVCRAIRALGLKDLYFQCNLRVDSITEELALELKAINCWLIHIGIESMNQRVLDGIRKKITVEQVVSACRLLKRNGLRVYGFMMFYNAWEEDGRLAFETPEEVDETIRRAVRMRREGLLDYMSWQFATPYPGADLYRVAVKYDLLEKDPKRSGQVWDLNMTLPGVSKRRMSRQRMKGLILQSYCYWRGGDINWRFWHNALVKIGYIIKSPFVR